MQLISKFYIIAFFLLTAFSNGFAQGDTLSNLKIGEWQEHLPWNTAKWVTQSDDKVYFASDWAVLEVDKDEYATRPITKVEGLSDISVGVIKYSRNSDKLVVTYRNSNIDIYNKGKVSNFPFIFKNPNILGDKQIYDIFLEGKFCYFACGFGLVKFDLEREEVVYTTFTGVKASAFAIANGNMYLGTEDGIYTLSSSNANPEVFTQWQLLGPSDGMPADYSCKALAVKDNVLFVGIDKTLYAYQNSILTLVDSDPIDNLLYISSEGDGLMYAFKGEYLGKVQYRKPNGIVENIHSTCNANRPFHGVEDGSGKFWFANDQDAGSYIHFNQNTNECKYVTVNSPFNHKSTQLVYANDKLYVATPGPPTTLGPPYFRDGIYVLENNTNWSRIYGDNTPVLQDSDARFDMWRVAVHPTNGKVYTGSWVGGLMEKNGDEVKIYNKNNSCLQGAGAAGVDRTAIGGLAFDADNNLWISNFFAEQPIAVLKADGTCRNFNAPNNGGLQVVVDKNGYKWFVLSFNGGVMVYDSGQNLDSPADDRYRIITSTNSVLPTNTVNTIAVDKEGDVWVGTQEGVVSFECGTNVFKEECKGSRRIVTVDGFNGYLLETEDVRAIAIDGANRKWFGTNNGLFVQSPSGDTQLEHFTETNSPLFDNSINSLTINGANGTVYIGTEKGIQAIRTEATDGTKVHRPTAYAYPNPVRPEYDGPIAIYGLAENSNIKVTDVAGNLVYEGTALGGQAVWNRRDYTGRKAASGVYLVIATSETNFDTPSTVLVKVVLLN